MSFLTLNNFFVTYIWIIHRSVNENWGLSQQHAKKIYIYFDTYFLKPQHKILAFQVKDLNKDFLSFNTMISWTLSWKMISIINVCIYELHFIQYFKSYVPFPPEWCPFLIQPWKHSTTALFYLHNNVVDWDVYQFYKKSNKSHNSKTNCCCHGNLLKFCKKIK